MALMVVVVAVVIIGRKDDYHPHHQHHQHYHAHACNSVHVEGCSMRLHPAFEFMGSYEWSIVELSVP